MGGQEEGMERKERRGEKELIGGKRRGGKERRGRRGQRFLSQ